MRLAHDCVVALLLAPGWAAAADLKPEERVIFFATAARLADDGQAWLVPIHGWTFGPQRIAVVRQGELLFLRTMLGLKPDESSTPLFEQRASMFLVDNHGGRKLTICIGQTTFPLPPSQPDGHIEATIRVPRELAASLAAADCLQFATLLPANDRRVIEGTVHLLPPEGTSVISDIDDTVKVSEVKDKRKMIENTFLLPFRPVERMPDMYRRWAQAGVRFHFVSNGPWQLYEPLQQFLQESRFPAATLQLRTFRLMDGKFMDFLGSPGEAKRLAIDPILQTYPRRRFVFVGDSGEQDPEAYGDLARKYPDRVAKIFIRDVTGEPADSPRYQRAFDKLSPDAWRVFRDPAELPPLAP